MLSRNTESIISKVENSDFIMIPDDSSSLVLITGSGLKDLGAVKDIIKMPASISCDVDLAKKILGY